MNKDSIIRDLSILVKELQKEISLLKEQLIVKNSRNSSKPPSTEMVPPKQTKSLRKSSGRKPGGQLGHKGSNLKMVANPNIIDKRIPAYCNNCGMGLTQTNAVLVSKRQLIDIPPIMPYLQLCSIFDLKQGEAYFGEVRIAHASATLHCDESTNQLATNVPKY